jgi:hypothetical protein
VRADDELANRVVLVRSSLYVYKAPIEAIRSGRESEVGLGDPAPL